MTPDPMKIHDISLTTSPRTLTWDGTEQGFSMHWAAQIGQPGEVCNLSVLHGRDAHGDTSGCPAALCRRRQLG